MSDLAGPTFEGELLNGATFGAGPFFRLGAVQRLRLSESSPRLSREPVAAGPLRASAGAHAKTEASGAEISTLVAKLTRNPPRGCSDPFADETETDGDAQAAIKGKNYVHVRVQQRNGRKSLTTVQARLRLNSQHHRQWPVDSPGAAARPLAASSGLLETPSFVPLASPRVNPPAAVSSAAAACSAAAMPLVLSDPLLRPRGYLHSIFPTT